MKAGPLRKSAIFLGLVAVVTLGGASAWAQEKGDKVTAKPDLPFGALESFVEIHAFFNMVHYENGMEGLEQGKRGFQAKEFYLMFSSQPHPKLYFNSELEYQPGEKPDVVNFRRLEIHWAVLKWVELDFGKFYSPVGIERNTHYAPLNRLISRPLPALYIVPGIWPEVGLRMHGEIEAAKIKVRYEAALVNGLGGAGRGGRQDWDNNDELAVAGRIGISPFPWLTVGASGYQGTYDDSDDFLLVIRGLDATVRYKGLTMIGEYLDSKIEMPEGNPEIRTGYYGQASYRFDAKRIHLIFVEPAVRFDHLDEAAGLELLSEIPDMNRLSAGLSLSPIPHFQLKGEYQWLWFPSPEIDNIKNIVFEAVVDF